MKRFIFVMALTAVLGFATLANANLTGFDINGDHFVYDSGLNITWYDFTFVAAEWDVAVLWASGLTVGGTTAGSWRLPTSDTCQQYGCTGSEMGHLYYTELVLTQGTPVSSSNQSPFTNLVPSLYWSGTVSPNPEYAGYFSFSDGFQGYLIKSAATYYALAVHPGNIGAQVPEPATMLLLGLGLIGLAGLRRKLKN